MRYSFLFLPYFLTSHLFPLPSTKLFLTKKNMRKWQQGKDLTSLARIPQNDDFFSDRNVTWQITGGGGGRSQS